MVCLHWELSQTEDFVHSQFLARGQEDGQAFCVFGFLLQAAARISSLPAYGFALQLMKWSSSSKSVFKFFLSMRLITHKWECQLPDSKTHSLPSSPFTQEDLRSPRNSAAHRAALQMSLCRVLAYFSSAAECRQPWLLSLSPWHTAAPQVINALARWM